jgi:sigma-B regulation protein RsbU (phosphoserine phosphatase)
MTQEKILLVDDNATNLQVLFQTLDGRGYNLLVAKNGETALKIAGKAKPDLILLDIMMPDIDGYEVCRRLKEDAATADAPVIFLSALGDTKDKVMGLDLGAVDYITKPFQPEEVIARVNTHLTIHSLRRQLQEKHDELEDELQLVAYTQRSLLPKSLPDIPGLKLAPYYQTSRYAGGDYYDILELPDNCWGFMMADAAGHSAQAAVMMAMTCALLRAFPDTPVNPAEVLKHLNENLCRLAQGTFMTALYAVYDAGRRTVTFSSAGHMPPMLFRPANAETIELPCKRIFPLAVEAYEDVPVNRAELQPGDRIMLYTDGISERFNPLGEPYGTQRLARQLARACGGNPQEILDWIIEDLDRFAAPLPAEDDQAILIGFVE